MGIKPTAEHEQIAMQIQVESDLREAIADFTYEWLNEHLLEERADCPECGKPLTLQYDEIYTADGSSFDFSFICAYCESEYDCTFATQGNEIVPTVGNPR